MKNNKKPDDREDRPKILLSTYRITPVFKKPGDKSEQSSPPVNLSRIQNEELDSDSWESE